MFICEQCGRQTSSGEKANSKVVEVRGTTYPGGYSGTVIVKEIKVCTNCSIQVFVYAPYIPMFKAPVVVTKNGSIIYVNDTEIKCK